MFLGTKARPGRSEGPFQLMCCGQEPVRLLGWKREQKQNNITSRAAFGTPSFSERRREEDLISKKQLAGFFKWGCLFGRPPDPTGGGGTDRWELSSPLGWSDGVLFFCEHLNWSRPKTRVHLSSLRDFWHNCRPVNLAPPSSSPSHAAA